MVQNQEILRTALNRAFDHRKSLNPRYSVRAFAQYLEIDASSLSKILSGERRAPANFIDSVERKLGVLSVRPEAVTKDKDVTFLSSREFQVIANWEHFAILDLVLLDTFRYDFAWMAAQLGLKEVDVRIAVDRLLKLGMLKEESGTLVKTQTAFSNDLGPNITSLAKKEYQRQLISKALKAIDGIQSERKDITSITIAADPKRLETAREMVKQFRRELCAYLEGGEKSEVYHLTIQLCPALSGQEDLQ